MQSENNKTEFDYFPREEKQAFIYMGQLKKYIESKNGKFLRDEDGGLHIILDGKRIPLTYDNSSEALAKMMLEACKVSTFARGAKPAIQRLRVLADKRAGRMSFRKFSALSLDGDRLYVPLEGGKLLLITPDGMKPVANGENDDSFWLEHPYDEALRYSDESPEKGLRLFEKLLVETQSCQLPEMKWLVAMGEGLFPYIRDAIPNRFLLVHQGGTQQGKTSGAQRFTLLHGLGEVMGDYSVASLGNVGDTGLLVLDNKEQANFRQDLIDFCLFLATGGQRGRSSTDGRVRTNRHRPVGVITTIEGVFKQEMEARCITVEYAVSGEKIGRAKTESAIRNLRHKITSALMFMLQRYFQIRGRYSSPNPISQFEEHFSVLCDLLRAYGEVAGNPEGWAEQIINKWDEVISLRSEDEEDELEQPIMRVFNDYEGEGSFVIHRVNYKGKRGSLYVTTATELLGLLQRLRLYDRKFPKNANGLTQRLRTGKFQAFRFLDYDSAPELEQLTRKSKRRPIGFFFEDETSGSDAVTITDAVETEHRHSLIC